MLRLEDLGGLLDITRNVSSSEAGRSAVCGPIPDLDPSSARGVTAEVLPTAAAVDRINELLWLGCGSWAGALHLTC